MIEPTKDAKKSPPSHSIERASNDPRARGNAATAKEDVVSNDETTRRNQELDKPSAATAQAKVDAPEVDAPTQGVQATDAGDSRASADNVPTVEASLKVSLQKMNVPRDDTSESKAAQDEEASQRATKQEADAPDALDRASNDPRAHPRGAAQQAAGDDSGQ